MEDKQTIQVGDIVTLKKQHPCGSADWKILRVGMDFRLRCMGCDHMIMVPRQKIMKSIKSIKKK